MVRIHRIKCNEYCEANSMQHYCYYFVGEFYNVIAKTTRRKQNSLHCAIKIFLIKSFVATEKNIIRKNHYIICMNLVHGPYHCSVLHNL